jgi:hypothetical protein
MRRTRNASFHSSSERRGLALRAAMVAWGAAVFVAYWLNHLPGMP